MSINDSNGVVKKQYHWIKVHCKARNDPKLRMLDEKYQLRLIWLWTLKMEREIPGLSDEEIAYSLRIEEEELDKTKQALLEKDLITDDWDIPNWDKYQANTADDSSLRVKKLRARQRNAGFKLSVSQKVKNKVHMRDGDSCVYCASNKSPTLDHIIPFDRCVRSEFCKNYFHSESNVVRACRSCNILKARQLPEEAGLSFIREEIRQMYLDTKKLIYDKDAMKRNVTVTAFPVTGPSVTVKRPSVTVERTSVTVEPKVVLGGEIVWPGDEKIKEWGATYPLVNVPDAVSYVKKLFNSGGVKIKNKTPEGVHSYLLTCIKNKQKEKDDLIHSKTLDKLDEKFKNTPQENLEEAILRSVVFDGLPIEQAKNIAKLRGIADLDVSNECEFYREIMGLARNKKTFTLSEAKKMAAERNFKIHRKIKLIIAKLDEEKKLNSWRPN